MKMVYHENLLNEFYSWPIFNSIESTKRLNHHVKEKGLWDFFCYRSNTVLISCLLDGADDVSNLNYKKNVLTKSLGDQVPLP